MYCLRFALPLATPLSACRLHKGLVRLQERKLHLNNKNKNFVIYFVLSSICITFAKRTTKEKMIFKRRHNDKGVPGLNTASLPDLIFTVLFFFMIVTNMRHDEVKVQYVEPDGKQLTKLENKSTATYIYIGRMQGSNDGDYQVQVDNQLMPANHVYLYVKKKKSKLDPESSKRMVVNIKADKQVPMQLVKQVKEQLKRADALLVHYSANEKD